MNTTIRLSGNLGERHRRFNSLVRDAFLQNTPLPTDYPEEPVLDRLLKIDLASKQKNVDYIIHTLKDDVMLYVSRALKSLWLLDPEHSKVINPSFLEHELFPQMILPAVNKMKHKIQTHLRDPDRCEKFYQFYKERDFDIAVKFLWHCSNECILCEINGIFDKITPKMLKRLSEKVPQISKIYYDNLKNNQSLLKNYLQNQTKFFGNVKNLLKSDAEVFFHILENFTPQSFSSLNASLTKYIMKNHKTRFDCKPELYTSWFLDIKTLAKCLRPEEIKDLVLKLAKAEYLKPWFSYQKVEPLIKRLGQQERHVFNKLTFVDKEFDTGVKEWPYPIPISLKLTYPQTSLFEDTDVIEKYYFQFCTDEIGHRNFQSQLKKCKASPWQRKTILNKLFDKYRFCSYKETLNTLRKQLKSQSSSENRQFMLLVLVSKTGGRMDDLVSFLELLSQFKNEPAHIRATIIRSLIKRAFAWRISVEHWANLLAWGHGLGLDGSTPEAACNEGLHAVVIRDLLADVKPSTVVWEKYLTNFDTLKGYSFTVEERRCISIRLSSLLVADAQSKNDKSNLTPLQHLIDTLKAYHIRFDDFPGTVETVVSAIKKNWSDIDKKIRNCAENLLRELYDARVARKVLIKEHFLVKQTDTSYINALRHDISIVDNTENMAKLIDGENLKHIKFFRKLSIYFMERNGLGERFRNMLEQKAITEAKKNINNPKECFITDPKKKHMQGRLTLAMPLALLSGSKFPTLLNVFEGASPDTTNRQMAAALRSHAHLVRPAFDLESFGWRIAGAKAVANRIIASRQRDVEWYLMESLSWTRTFRLGLALAKRVNKERDAFEVFASKRPSAALQAALKYFHREGENSDPRIWEMVKSYISKANSRQLVSFTKHFKCIPVVIRAEYCFLVYLACKLNEPKLSLRAYSKIPAILPELDERYILNSNDLFLRDYFTEKNKDYNKEEFIALHMEVIAKFLVLSTSEEMLEQRFKRVGKPLLNQLKLMWKQKSETEEDLECFLDYFLFYLRYNRAYFDAKYVSCFPVLERVTEWMHTFLPIEKYFDKYATVHLTMIYLKTVKHCITQSPELFSEESKKLEGSEMLGTIFGKFIGHEIEELSLKYFPTVTEVYASGFLNYLNDYICHTYDGSIEKFTIAMLNELMINKSRASCILAKYILDKCRNRLNVVNVNDVTTKFKKSGIEELLFYVDVE